MTARMRLTAWVLGIRDGWREPYDLSTSTNTEHLGCVQESQDRGINLGQLLRAGPRSQAVRLHYWKVWP